MPLARITKMSIKALEDEKAGRKIHPARARRLVELGLAVYLEDGRCVLKQHIRDTLAGIRREFWRQVVEQSKR